MDPSQPQPPPPRSKDSWDLFTETRTLRRKVAFWRRTAGLLLGGVAVFFVVVWNRGEIRRRDCYQTLGAYARAARENRLGEQHPDLLEQQWQDLPQQAGTGIPASHYDLIVAHWSAAPRPGEKIPLAVCREAHATALTRGRHVLFLESNDLRIEWLDESEAAPIAALAARDNH